MCEVWEIAVGVMIGYCQTDGERIPEGEGGKGIW